jgi:uncharacterized protein (TIGR02246 family)
MEANMITVCRWTRRRAAALAVLVLGVLVPPAFGAGSPREAIEAANRVWMAGFAAGDAAKMASIYADDAVVFPPGAARVNGREAIAQFWGGFLKNGFKNLVLKTLEVEAQGDLAFEGGEVTFDIPQKDGKPAKAAVKYIVVWKRVSSGWQIHRDIWNDLPPR